MPQGPGGTQIRKLSNDVTALWARSCPIPHLAYRSTRECRSESEHGHRTNTRSSPGPRFVALTEGSRCRKSQDRPRPSARSARFRFSPRPGSACSCVTLASIALRPGGTSRAKSAQRRASCASASAATRACRPSLLGALADCYGEDLVAQIAVRAPIQVDARRLVVGTEEVTLASDDVGELLSAYVAIVARLRHTKAGAPIALRADDLAALSTASGQSSEHVEARIAELLDCTLGDTPSLHSELQRRKLTLPYAGVVSGIAMIAAVSCSAATPKTSPGPPALPHHLVVATRPVPTRKATARPRPAAGKIHRPVNTQAGANRSTTVPSVPRT